MIKEKFGKSRQGFMPLATAAAVSLALSACGGGGGDGNQQSSGGSVTTTIEAAAGSSFEYGVGWLKDAAGNTKFATGQSSAFVFDTTNMTPPFHVLIAGRANGVHQLVSTVVEQQGAHQPATPYTTLLTAMAYAQDPLTTFRNFSGGALNEAVGMQVESGIKNMIAPVVTSLGGDVTSAKLMDQIFPVGDPLDVPMDLLRLKTGTAQNTLFLGKLDQTDVSIDLTAGTLGNVGTLDPNDPALLQDIRNTVEIMLLSLAAELNKPAFNSGQAGAFDPVAATQNYTVDGTGLNRFMHQGANADTFMKSLNLAAQAFGNSLSLRVNAIHDIKPYSDGLSGERWVMVEVSIQDATGEVERFQIPMAYVPAGNNASAAAYLDGDQREAHFEMVPYFERRTTHQAGNTQVETGQGIHFKVDDEMLVDGATDGSLPSSGQYLEYVEVSGPGITGSIRLEKPTNTPAIGTYLAPVDGGGSPYDATGLDNTRLAMDVAPGVFDLEQMSSVQGYTYSYVINDNGTSLPQTSAQVALGLDPRPLPDEPYPDMTVDISQATASGAGTVDVSWSTAAGVIPKWVVAGSQCTSYTAVYSKRITGVAGYPNNGTVTLGPSGAGNKLDFSSAGCTSTVRVVGLDPLGREVVASEWYVN